MSEVEKHYGGDDRPKPSAARAGDAKATDDASLLDRAADALADARESAAHTAGKLRDRASDRYEKAQDWAQESYESLSRNAVYARRRGVAELNRGRRGVEAFVEENPIMVGVAGIAAGLLIGALLPSTRRENQLLGPYADDIRREGARYARDVAQQGREAIADNLRSMGQTHGRDRT